MSLYQKYFKNVKHLDEVDVYRVLNLFDVTDHALGHAVKKLLLCGVRTGGKTTIQEVVEARDTLNRWVEMEREDGNHTELYDFSHPTKITSDDIEEVEEEEVEEEEVVEDEIAARWLKNQDAARSRERLVAATALTWSSKPALKPDIAEVEEVEEVEEVVEEDMSDPSTWLPGCIIKCVSNRNCHFTPNGKYVFKELTHNGNVTYAHVEHDDEGDPNSLRVDFFEWHSRSLSASLNNIIQLYQNER